MSAGSRTLDSAVIQCLEIHRKVKDVPPAVFIPVVSLSVLFQMKF